MDDKNDDNGVGKEVSRYKSSSIYIPPLNFAPIVNSSQDIIYRSGFPMPLNYPYLLNTLNLKTIIYLGDKVDLLPEYVDFIEKGEYQFYHLLMNSTTDKNIQELMEKMLELVLDKRNYPILIHSNKGKHRIGVAAGIIRKILQGWSITGIYQEYGIFTGNVKGEMDLEFINSFCVRNPLKVDPKYLPSFVNFET
ncbi:hypothetical protein ACO0QE_001174 [Hanseniaspora vineae]